MISCLLIRLISSICFLLVYFVLLCQVEEETLREASETVGMAVRFCSETAEDAKQAGYMSEREFLIRYLPCCCPKPPQRLHVPFVVTTD